MMRETFRKQCEINGIKPKELVKDMAVRWNSTYFMLKRAYGMKLVISLINKLTR